MEQKKYPKQLYVKRLKAGQKVETKTGGFVMKNNETSIYISEDVTFKAGTTLYLNPIEEHFAKLVEIKKMDEDKAADSLAKCREYNQSHVVSVYSKK